MTSNEIIKALECCLKTNQAYKCTDCRYYNKTANCLRSLMTDTVDVINRQQAKIESLNNKLIEQQLKNNMLYETSLEIKSEAIKEFAERLTDEYKTTYYLPGDDDLIIVAKSDMDNLIKEMVGGENDG